VSVPGADVITLLEDVSKDLIQTLRRPVRIGLSGAQGSGKTTIARAWAKSNPRIATFSLDDIYLNTADRKALAAKVSPLFRVRGAPGTHDLALGKRTLEKLGAARARDRTPLPRFDKLGDHPVPANEWPTFEGTANIVLVDGWCLGATPEKDEALSAPVNDLEREQDKDGAWRGYTNAQLEGPYAQFFTRFDAIVHLAAPSWDVVPRWRLEQEAGLRGIAVDAVPQDVRANIIRFCNHYERVTRHMLAGGLRAEWIVRLGEDREALDIEGPR
jgi:D-glycerate 3-kinase